MSWSNAFVTTTEIRYKQHTCFEQTCMNERMLCYDHKVVEITNLEALSFKSINFPILCWKSSCFGRSYETDVMWFDGDPICVSTLSSHWSGPSKWISIQHGVEVTSWRWYSAPHPLTKDILQKYTEKLNLSASCWKGDIIFLQTKQILHGTLWFKPNLLN